VVGTGAALGAVGLIANYLYEVSPSDSITLLTDLIADFSYESFQFVHVASDILPGNSKTCHVTSKPFFVLRF
jgi:hypothetical protein